MTRTNKWTIHEARGEPKWFTHHGPVNADPTKIKKMGAGNHNWGRPGDELDELDGQFSFFGKSGRRNSNHQENEEKMNTLNNKLEEDLSM